jgi:hypothetical protein
MSLLSLTEVSDRLRARGCDVPIWHLRRVVDTHFADRIRRFGLLRTIPENLLPAVEALCRQPRRRRRRAKAVSS